MRTAQTSREYHQLEKDRAELHSANKLLEIEREAIKRMRDKSMAEAREAAERKAETD